MNGIDFLQTQLALGPNSLDADAIGELAAAIISFWVNDPNVSNFSITAAIMGRILTITGLVKQ